MKEYIRIKEVSQEEASEIGKLDDSYYEVIPLEKLENPGDMNAYQITVVDQAYELDDDIDMLENHLVTPEFAELEKDEQGRLKSQLLAMKAYLTILIDRINNFEIKKK